MREKRNHQNDQPVPALSSFAAPTLIRFQLVNVSSIVLASLSYFGEYGGDNHEKMRSQLLELLERLEHVKELHLWDWCIQILNKLQESSNCLSCFCSFVFHSDGAKLLGIMEEKGLRSPLLRCECLTLVTGMWKSVLLGIAHMLESSHTLETLVITMSSSSYHEVCKL
ncbi:hypothetical protein RHMOL_Rhmol13G0226300 [Rhododendron molle]|uniref:Uncharacterized protein n=1 Tax=Rhododendron molle TaxID=49168 RepID=A0ACC0L9I3_RHOML|nr:hypothetical protein RHMOL_Rhmol13G0226300 [Rhododendron molle]